MLAAIALVGQALLWRRCYEFWMVKALEKAGARHQRDCATEAAENARERKIVSGSKGCSVHISTMTKQANVHTAAAKQPIVARLFHPQ